MPDSLIWFRRLPVDTFVLDVMRMVLFSSLGPGPPPPPPPPDPPLAEDGIGPLPLAPDMGATFDAGIKLGLFVISLLQGRENSLDLYALGMETHLPCLLYLYIMV